MRNVQLAALASAFTATASLSVPLHATFWGGPRLLVDVAPEAATGKQVLGLRRNISKVCRYRCIHYTYMYIYICMYIHIDIDPNIDIDAQRQKAKHVI